MRALLWIVFESDHLKEQTFSWNPSICDTLMAVCKNYIDNQIDFDLDDPDTDGNGFKVTDSSAEGDTTTLVYIVIQVTGYRIELDSDSLIFEQTAITLIQMSVPIYWLMVILTSHTCIQSIWIPMVPPPDTVGKKTHSIWRWNTLSQWTFFRQTTYILGQSMFHLGM